MRNRTRVSINRKCRMPFFSLSGNLRPPSGKIRSRLLKPPYGFISVPDVKNGSNQERFTRIQSPSKMVGFPRRLNPLHSGLSNLKQFFKGNLRVNTRTDLDSFFDSNRGVPNWTAISLFKSLIATIHGEYYAKSVCPEMPIHRLCTLGGKSTVILQCGMLIDIHCSNSLANGISPVG